MTELQQEQYSTLKLFVIGLGLIGGSVARGLKQRGIFAEIIGYSRNRETRETAIANEIVDCTVESVQEGVEQADIVLIAVPTLSVGKILQDIAPYILEETVITDAASVKGSVVQEVVDIFGKMPSNFVPGHPIAGSEKSGVEAANGDLYVAHQVLLTPVKETSKKALQLVTFMWQCLGANVVNMSVSHHDEVLAATSHLPHLLAYSLVNTLSNQSSQNEIFHYAAGGFRDFTRIASSDPTMWRDIFLANSEATVKILDAFSDDLQQLKQLILGHNGEALMTVFQHAKTTRDYFSHIFDDRIKQSQQQQTITQDNPSMVDKNIQFSVAPGGRVSGEARVPGDKSISHRSIMLGALADGITTVSGFLEGEDSLATLNAFRQMGVTIEGPDEGKVIIHGVGMKGLQKPDNALDLGNSGTSMRLLCGLMAAQEFDVCLVGDESLSTRPMGRVTKPLTAMGAVISTAENGTPPVNIRGAQNLKSIHYDLPMASAQVKSALLLAGLYADGETVITEPAPTRDHTERMLRGFAYEVKTNGNRISLKGGGNLSAGNIDVPADISSAAFFLVAASIAKGSDLLLQHVGINPTRVGIINLLMMMGADITIQNERLVGGEPVADIRVRSANLTGINIPQDQVPLAIDEFPVLFIAAACAKGETVLSGAEELRVKESDRIQVMADGLRVLGIEQEVTADGIIIQGGELGGGIVDSHGDHRIAMAFTIAGLCAKGNIVITDCLNVSTSFPGFVELACQLGIRVSAQ